MTEAYKADQFRARPTPPPALRPNRIQAGGAIIGNHYLSRTAHALFSIGSLGGRIENQWGTNQAKT